MVDNASQKDEASIISEKYPQVKVVRSFQNLGFAGGNNLGIKASKGEYILLINNDTYFKEFNIAPLIKRLKSSDIIGIVCPKLRFAWGNNPIQYARMQLLKQLEPYQDSDIEQLSNMLIKGLVDKNKFMIKLNFEDFVMRFERENMDILEFGKQLPLTKNIEIITNIFIDYVDDQETIERPNQAADGTQKRFDEA